MLLIFIYPINFNNGTPPIKSYIVPNITANPLISKKIKVHYGNRPPINSKISNSLSKHKCKSQVAAVLSQPQISFKTRCNNKVAK